MWDVALLWTVIVGLWLVGLVGVVMVALQLPGTWVMLAAAAVAAWWGWAELPGDRLIGWMALGAMLVLAVLGEVVEAIAGALGARTAGGSKRGAFLAVIGGIAGAIAGTFVIPVPILGTLLGAAIGAGVMSTLGDKWAGRKTSDALKAGGGAAVGKFAGAVAKLGIAVAMWLIVVAATLF